MSNPKIGNGTVQWVLKLRQQFQDSKNNNQDGTKTANSIKSNNSGFGNPPSCYYSGTFTIYNWMLMVIYLDLVKQKQHKSVSDIQYQGNAREIYHGLKYPKGGCKELQEVVTLRSFSNDANGIKMLALISKNRVHHSKKFQVLPLNKNEKDYSTYMPHDKQSVVLKKSINVKVRNDPYDMPNYESKLCDKNLNNSRHLMHGSQHMSSLKWEFGLRDY
jgi:hypothetical protein